MSDSRVFNVAVHKQNHSKHILFVRIGETSVRMMINSVWLHLLMSVNGTCNNDAFNIVAAIEVQASNKTPLFAALL